MEHQIESNGKSNGYEVSLVSALTAQKLWLYAKLNCLTHKRKSIRLKNRPNSVNYSLPKWAKFSAALRILIWIKFIQLLHLNMFLIMSVYVLCAIYGVKKNHNSISYRDFIACSARRKCVFAADKMEREKAKTKTNPNWIESRFRSQWEYIYINQTPLSIWLIVGGRLI